MASAKPKAAKPTVPCLIVPGFMSSGLEIHESVIKPSWQGQRIWMSIARLGVSSMHSAGVFETFRAPVDDDEAEEQTASDVLDGQPAVDQEQMHLKNQWLEHLILTGPGEEQDGVRVRAVPGLDGVDFLEKGALSHLTYVFGPVIAALKKKGYKEQDTLDALSYDWRIAPGFLQSRDNYFEDMVAKIEKMNQGVGVALLAHSMGNKTVPYFLRYAEKTRGRAWLDANVYSWICLGAPTLGAPAAARATLTGDRMGLEAFLSMNEAVVMGRSFSSSPWLFPIGAQAEDLIYVRRQGLLEVRCVEAQVPRRGLRSKNRVQLAVVISWGKGRETEVLDSKCSHNFDGRNAYFDGGDILQFGGPAELPPDARIRVLIKEKKNFRPDDDMRSFGTCCYRIVCIPLLIFDLICFAFTIVYKVLSGLRHMFVIICMYCRGRGSIAIPKAHTKSRLLKKLTGDSLGSPLFDRETGSSSDWRTVDLQLTHPLLCLCCFPRGFVKLQVRWKPFKDLYRQSEDSRRIQPIQHSRKPALHRYESVRMDQMMDLEYIDHPKASTLGSPSQVWKNHYVNDPLYDHTGLNDVPPVKRVVSVNGTNMRTEVGYAYRLNTKRTKCKHSMMTRYVLDDEAELVPSSDLNARCIMRGGIISEEPGRGQPTGDGTVPACSLNRSRAWEGPHLNYKEVSLDRAEHRGMLSDSRTHNAIFDALTLPDQLGTLAPIDLGFSAPDASAPP